MRKIEIIIKVFASEYFEKALVTTFAVVLPTAILFAFNLKETAIGTGLGALLVSLTDMPGDKYEKAISLSLNSLLLAVVTLITSFALSNSFFLGPLIFLCCFVFSFIGIYGTGATAIGSIALVMMIFTIGLHPAHGLAFGSFIMAGGLVYTSLGIIYLRIFPYRPIKQALSDCIGEVGLFLKSKAGFYQIDRPLNDCYGEVISSHIKVSEKQEAVRSILLRKSIIFQQEDKTGMRLIFLAAEIIDLYEQILVIHYDYAFLRKMLFDLGILKQVERLMQLMAGELNEIGLIVKSSRKLPRTVSVMDRAILLKGQLESAEASVSGLKSKLIRKIIRNFETIDEKLQNIKQAANESILPAERISSEDAVRFAPEPLLILQLFKNNFSFKSPIFRFALRVSVICVSCYYCMLFLFPGKYNYWLLLTIIIIARPGFSTTLKRNSQRLKGTTIGIFIAFLTIYFVHSFTMQVILLIICLLGYLSFLYTSYLVSVVFISILAIVGLHLLGGNDNELILQRSYDTLFGGAIALIAAFLFPFWESRKLKTCLKAMLVANVSYLEKLQDYLSGNPFNLIEYKLARKQLFISSANLSTAYQHMLNEPKSTKINTELIYQFQVSNHELYASVAALLLDGFVKSQSLQKSESLHQARVAVTYLKEAVNSIADKPNLPVQPDKSETTIKSTETLLQKEIILQQLDVIVKLAKSIYLQTSKISFD